MGWSILGGRKPRYWEELDWEKEREELERREGRKLGDGEGGIWKNVRL